MVFSLAILIAGAIIAVKTEWGRGRIDSGPLQDTGDAGACRLPCSVTGHVLDHAGLMAGQFANAVMIGSRTRIEFGCFVDCRLQIGLSSFLCQIRAGDIHL